MPKPITVADLIAACAKQGINPADAVLLVEDDIPLLATAAEPAGILDFHGTPRHGFLIAAPDADEH